LVQAYAQFAHLMEWMNNNCLPDEAVAPVPWPPAGIDQVPAGLTLRLAAAGLPLELFGDIDRLRVPLGAQAPAAMNRSFAVCGATGSSHLPPMPPIPPSLLFPRLASLPPALGASPFLRSRLLASLACGSATEEAPAKVRAPAYPPAAAMNAGRAQAMAATTHARPDGSSTSSVAARGKERVARVERKGRDTLRTYLEELRHKDPRCIFIARRINTLGFRSRSLLERHFTRYGKVEQVFVAHSRVKPTVSLANGPRTRPGNFGLVVMTSFDAVRRILEEGPELTVSGNVIQVQRFEQLKEDYADDQRVSTPDDADNAVEEEREAESPTMDSYHPGARQGRSSGSLQPSSSGAYKAQRPNAWEDTGSTTTCGDAWNRDSTEDSGRSAQSAGMSSSDGFAYEAARRTNGEAGWGSTVQLSEVLEELRRVAGEAPNFDAFTREQSIHAAALAHLAQQSLKQLEQDCANKLIELSAREHKESVAAAYALTGPPGLKPSNNAAGASSNGAVHAAVAASPHQAEGTERGHSNKELQTVSARKLPRADERQSDGARRNKMAEATPSLREHLLEMKSEDPQCVFVARRINKLGFRSKGLLHQYFSQYGPVSRVLVAHSQVKHMGDSCGQLRTRPGSLGLIVMKHVASVRRILALGDEQKVGGHTIYLQSFKCSDQEMGTSEQTTSAGGSTSTSSPGTSTSTGSGSGSGSGGSGSVDIRSSSGSGSGSGDVRSDGSGGPSPEKSEEGGSSEPYEKYEEEEGASSASYGKYAEEEAAASDSSQCLGSPQSGQ